MLEIPNICYIFGKLGVQGCQIWHSHVSIPFNSASAHSTRPHNAKKLFTSSFQAIFLKIGFTKVTCTCSFLCTCTFWSSHCSQVPRAYLGKTVTQRDTSNTQKTAENGRIWAKNGKKCTVENCGTTYPKSKNNCSLFSSIYHVERPVSRKGHLKLKFLCNQISHCIYSFCSIEFN